MDYSAQLSYNQLSKFLDTCLDFYKDGIYSLESVDEGKCSTQKRKSMKNDFKEYFVGTKSKPKTINPKVLCIIEALLDADTSKVIELKRRNRQLNNKFKELETEKQNGNNYELNQIRRELETSIRQKIQSEQTDSLMRQTNKLLRYEDIIKNLEAKVSQYRTNYVERELLDKSAENYLEIKELYDNVNAKLKKFEQKEDKELHKQLEKEDKEKAKKKAEIEKKRKELEDLEASI
jgi:chromosome segregation ATPase